MKLAIFVCLAGLVSGAARTASVTGNWNNTATWGGSAAPVSGDTAVINDGITVTIPSGYTAVVGTSPADDTTMALSCASTIGTGILIVATGGTLQYQGPIGQCNADWTVQAGATVTHDSSLSMSPSSNHYDWFIGTDVLSQHAHILITGSSGSHATFNIAGGSGFAGGFYYGSALDGGMIQATYADFSSWGHFFWTMFSSGESWSCDHCTIDNSGPIFNAANFSTNVTFSFTNSIITNTTSDPGPGSGISIALESGGDGTATITNSVINTYLAVLAASATNTITNSIMVPGFAGGNAGGNIVTATDLLLFNNSSGSGEPNFANTGTYTRLIGLRGGTSINPHWFYTTH